MPPIELSVIVTVFSETFSVTETVERVRNLDRGYLKEFILVVSPSSSAESMAICERLTRQDPLVRMHVQERNPGVGWALREGMSLAEGTHCALMSGDLETEPEAVDRMIRKLQETGCDGVIGNRWLRGGGFRNYNPVKLVLNWMFQNLFRILYRTKLGDLTYGFKILSREMARSINWTGTLHEVFIETTVRPLKLGYRLEQVPTTWIGRREGESKNKFARNFRYVALALRVLASSGRSDTCKTRP
jgi:glycosyltransferase involved in cell wall biosynthesis